MIIDDPITSLPPKGGGHPQSSLDLEWIDDEDRWSELRDVWDELVLATGSPSIFNTWDFLDVSWRVFARPAGDRLAVLVLREGRRPVGVVPLRLVLRRRLGLRLRKLKRLASWESDRVPFVFPEGREPECAAAVLRFLDSNSARWDALELREVAAQGEFAAALHKWADGRTDVLLQVAEASPSPYVWLEGSWEDLLSGLSSATRKGFRRRMRRLEQEGPHTLREFREPSDICRGLDGYLQVESRSWKPSSGQGIGKNVLNRAFYRRLLPLLAARERARVVLLEQAGRSLAGIVELRLGASVYASQITFDRSYARSSPGFVLQGLRIKSALEEGAREYELFAKFLEDKLHWTKRLRRSVDIRLLRWSGLRGSVLFAGSRLRRLIGVSERKGVRPARQTGA